jgi:hypothetical protein
MMKYNIFEIFHLKNEFVNLFKLLWLQFRPDIFQFYESLVFSITLHIILFFFQREKLQLSQTNCKRDKFAAICTQNSRLKSFS